MSKKSTRKSIEDLSARIRSLESAVIKLGETIAGNPSESSAPATTPAKAPSLAAPKKIIRRKPHAKKATPAPAPATPVKAVTTTSVKKKTTPSPAKVAKVVAKTPTKKTDGKAAPTLVEALKHVLALYRSNNSGPARAAQLYEDVQQAGYKFGGAKRENNLNYLYKLLRTNKVFKRVGDGQYTLA